MGSTKKYHRHPFQQDEIKRITDALEIKGNEKVQLALTKAQSVLYIVEGLIQDLKCKGLQTQHYRPFGTIGITAEAVQLELLISDIETAKAEKELHEQWKHQLIDSE